MPREIAPTEMLAEFEEWLPSGLAELYHALWQEVASLNVGWNSYIELYDSGEERIKLLLYSAESFFGFLQTALFSDVLLSIMRLTDPPKSAGRCNLTLLRLPGKLQSLDHHELAKKVKDALNPLKQAVASIRIYRNEWLTHRDLKIGLQRDRRVWDFSIEDVGESVKLINGILNLIEWEVRESETRFEDVIEHGGTAHLIFALEQAWKAELREKKERLERAQR